MKKLKNWIFDLPSRLISSLVVAVFGTLIILWVSVLHVISPKSAEIVINRLDKAIKGD